MALDDLTDFFLDNHVADVAVLGSEMMTVNAGRLVAAYRAQRTIIDLLRRQAELSAKVDGNPEDTETANQWAFMTAQIEAMVR